ncbi:MAG: HAD-IC family P-type ATPase [Myxococcales bacterium]|nr:HAD-IC family P-type ATPase [Myxococcales bacterium]
MARSQEPRSREAPAVSWHTLPSEEVLSALRSTHDGLSTEEANERIAAHGPNVLDKKGGVSVLELIWGQINNPLIWVLLGSAVVAILVDPVDGLKNGLVILAVVIINTVIGFAQEYKASKAIESLSAMVPELATVQRDGKRVQLAVAEIVPGDVVFLQSGDKVPADIRLLQLRTLQIEEAALTGESVPVEKTTDPVAADAGLGDRKNMAFSGSLVTYGSGAGVVTTTGNGTELGRINTMLSEATEIETPLSIALKKIGVVLTVGIAVISVVILAVGTGRAVSQGGVDVATGLRESAIFAITLAVGAIPEGLPAIVTIALAIGVQRMAARRAVVRKLPSVETLGSTTVICSDKTGTLTRNEMTVQGLCLPQSGVYRIEGVGYEPTGRLLKEDEAVAPVPEDVRQLLLAGVLCCDATLEQKEGRWHITGDPTEGALVTAGEKLGIRTSDARAGHARLDAIPFESANQFMATLNHWGDEGKKIILKGAPEVVLSRCTEVDRPAVIYRVEELAKEGMRVLGFAEKRFERAELGLEDCEDGFVFLGLQAMIDPPRTDAIDAIGLCHRAGITVKMITGDHKGTAQAIGEQLGIAAQGAQAVTGVQLADLDDAATREIVEKNNVFARMAPEHKLRLVRALQENGHVTAMTGDGVNDAPALKQSNIGVAMGITGTSVSKEAADIVLTDDNFASIAAAVEEGRRVYDNLIKSLAFVLPTNLGLALILIYAVGFFPLVERTVDGVIVKDLLLPVLPTQLLWVNLVAAVALALPLAFEAKEPDVMSRPPRDPKEPVLNRFVVIRTLVAATLMTAGSVGLFIWKYEQEMAARAATGLTEAQIVSEAQTMAVTTVIMFQIFYMLNCRSLKDSIFRIGVFSNKAVFVGIGAISVLQALFIYLPAMQVVFGTFPLSTESLFFSVLAGAIILPVITVEKLVRNHKPAA